LFSWKVLATASLWYKGSLCHPITALVYSGLTYDLLLNEKTGVIKKNVYAIRPILDKIIQCFLLIKRITTLAFNERL